jgi:hypothetical protein
MRRQVGLATIAAVVVLSFVWFGAGFPAGQTPGAKEGVRRTPDRKPDLNGVWQALTTASWDLEDHNAQKGAPAGQGVVEGGTIPYLSAAAATKKTNSAKRAELDPLHKCYLPGIPRLMYMPFPFLINQTPEMVSITFEYNHAYRWIWTDGSKHPEAIDFWMGDSRGRWEGDTLVVDVTNFNGNTWFDRAGNFHSDALRLTERFTPRGADHILYEVTVEDSKTFSKPWKISVPLYRRIEQNVQTLDYECLEFEEPLLEWDELPAPGLPGPPKR